MYTLEKAISLAKTWASSPSISQEDRKIIKEMIDSGQENTLLESFGSHLEFGTGGMRSILGLGTAKMNIYNIQKATQALAQTVINSGEKNLCAVVSYDCRNFSYEFAKEVASVFAGNGFKVHIFKELTPTPILSFAIRELNATTGVMVTASHNPKEYNGYKAYWSDGAQLTPPYDKNVVRAFTQIDDLSKIKRLNFEESISNGQVNWIQEELFNKFYESIENQLADLSLCKKEGDSLDIIYTSLHGTGLKPCLEIAKRTGFTGFKAFEPQMSFDGNFTSVETTPNPEDPKALGPAVERMLADNADLVYGTDPDCDRLGVCVNHKGQAHFLNGNQIAILFLHHLLETKEKGGLLRKGSLVLKSIVTSPLQNIICEHYNTEIVETLTGFKWMARELAQRLPKTYQFIFASEESFGYMPNKDVRDKDAVASIAIMNEIALLSKREGKTLVDKLDDIYIRFGFSKESLIALTFKGIEGKEFIQKIMNHFRENISLDIAGHTIHKKIDFLNSKDPDLKSNVLGFMLDDHIKLFLRPSGTEPKIKFYTMAQVLDGQLDEKKQKASKKISKIENFIHQTIESLK